MNRIRKFFTASILMLSLFSAKANISILPMPADSAIPQVFILGQYDGVPFERMKKDYETTLATACRNDYETAYYCWLHLLKHLESHATKKNYDLNGVKLWLYAFWEKDGTLGYIAYYPKPNSKNFKAEEMNAFLSDFCKTYTLPLKFEKPYSNYSTANFPVMVEKVSGTGDASTKSSSTPTPNGTGIKNTGSATRTGQNKR